MEQQRTEDWFLARAGHVTASRIADVVAKTKTGVSASRASYLAQLVAERLTGEPTNGYSTPAMQWGIDTEAAAIAAYEDATGTVVESIGFIKHPSIEWSGASPDGVVTGLDMSAGLVECKCPQTHTHIEYLRTERIPGKYLLQMQWQMACTGYQWCDWVSYDPRLTADLALLVIRVHRDAEEIHQLETEVRHFLVEVDEAIQMLLKKRKNHA